MLLDSGHNTSHEYLRDLADRISAMRHDVEALVPQEDDDKEDEEAARMQRHMRAPFRMSQRVQM